MKKQKERIDQLLVTRGLAESRSKAQALIMSGAVRTGGRVLDKPGIRLDGDAPIEVVARGRHVGRGGLKLEAALDAFGVDPVGASCLDIGASTGGFTDCLLQRGARRVVALDVGHGQLHWKLREDPRVTCMERCNARHLEAGDLPEAALPLDLLVADVSFISLERVLPPSLPLLRPGGDAIVLVKPQFEAGRGQVGKGGIVTSPEIRQAAVDRIRRFAEGAPWVTWRGVIESPIHGADGNVEFLAWMRAPGGPGGHPVPA